MPHPIFPGNIRRYHLGEAFLAGPDRWKLATNLWPAAAARRLVTRLPQRLTFVLLMA